MEIIREGSLWHVGIVVADIGDAIRDFERHTGIAFHEPTRRPTRIRVGGRDGDVRDVEMAFTFTTGPLPLFELVEPVPDTAIARPGTLHLGYWSDDFEHDTRALDAHGSPEVVAEHPHGPDSRALFSYHEGPVGMLIELVPSFLRQAIEARSRP